MICPLGHGKKPEAFCDECGTPLIPENVNPDNYPYVVVNDNDPCPNCLFPLKLNQKYCPSCGSKLEWLPDESMLSQKEFHSLKVGDHLLYDNGPGARQLVAEVVVISAPDATLLPRIKVVAIHEADWAATAKVGDRFPASQHQLFKLDE